MPFVTELQKLLQMSSFPIWNRYGKISSGREKIFDAATFASLCGDIRNVNLGDLQLLVYGFSDQYRPHIFTVQGLGEDVVYDKLGFASIGSGSYAAETLLMYFNQSRRKSLSESIANVCSAKFLAERVPSGVGHETHIYVTKHGKTIMRYWALAS